MTISNSLALSLRSPFILEGSRNTNDIANVRYNGNSILVKDMGTRSFVPSICESIVIPSLAGAVHRDIVVSLPSPNQEVRKTADSLINVLFRQPSWCAYGKSFKYIDTTKGYGYYGGKGLILTDGYKPLLVCGYEVEITPSWYNYETPICFISPDVFTRDDMVSKCIVKKIIPYYSSTIISGGTDRNGNYCPNHKIKIIISSEIDGFIHKAVAPLSIDVNDALYNILASNMATLQAR